MKRGKVYGNIKKYARKIYADRRIRWLAIGSVPYVLYGS